MSSLEEVREALSPLAHAVAGLDLSDPEAARGDLERRFPFHALGELGRILRGARDAGVLTPRSNEGVAFGRVARPSPETAGLSIDAVDIAGTGAEHTHLEGEVSLCFAEEGDPRFDGHPEGWVVLPPGSHHAPTVEGGRMLIVYFMPNGAVRWGPPHS